VISIGNITAGGTGKTPLAMDVVGRLLAWGRKPAVVSRGYRALPGEEADELAMVRRRLPGVPCIACPDRVSGARQAVQKHGADTIVLDDAFQHRRIGRDLDIVLIDATCPFGRGHLLPRGLLREPLCGLRRASLVVLSRCDQASREQLRAIDAALDVHAPLVPRIRCLHRPTGLVRVDGSRTGLEPEDVGPAWCFAAIGNPAAFRSTVGAMGIEAVGEHWWADHHAYTGQEMEETGRAAHAAGATVLLTTEKDAVKLGELADRASLPVYAVRVEIDFAAGGDTILESALERVVQARRG
jgi:tetraacyldisaccharide 4'-kinase